MIAELVILLTVLNSSPNPKVAGISSVELASRTISMEERYGNTYVNNVFKDNMLLTLNYLSGTVKSKNDVNWDSIEKPLSFDFTLNPNETFAFHDQIAKEYDKNVVKTTNAHFNYSDGFKSDGYLTGDGVCHLASIIYWVAKDAGLNAIAPTNHNFAIIPEIPKEYGVSIYSTSATQNLYITNNFDKPITFTFDYNGTDLKVSVDMVK